MRGFRSLNDQMKYQIQKRDRRFVSILYISLTDEFECTGPLSLFPARQHTFKPGQMRLRQCFGFLFVAINLSSEPLQILLG